VAGESGSSNGTRAFRWTEAGGMSDLGVLPGWTSSQAEGISADGSAVTGVCSITNDSRAFRWTADGGMQDLGVLPGGSHSVGWALNGDGSVVVGASAAPSADHAFLWTSALGMVDLNTYLPLLGVNLTGWTLVGAHSISADGSAITGLGSFNGQGRVWLITGLPEPTTAALLGLAALCGLRRSRGTNHRHRW
jgi:probable HAF family extracellular repeat protein